MGNDLFSEVTKLTGLPEELIRAELTKLLEGKGISPDKMTMDCLRSALTDYLHQVEQAIGSASAAAVSTLGPTQ